MFLKWFWFIITQNNDGGNIKYQWWIDHHDDYKIIESLKYGSYQIVTPVFKTIDKEHM